MPLYPYIPYLDPDMDETARRSFSGHGIADADQDGDVGQNKMDHSEKLRVTQKTPMESFKRKVNDNLKILNLKMSNIIQDSLNGVDSLCRQVKGCLTDNGHRQNKLDNFMETCGSGDIFAYRDEKNNKSPATSQDATYILNQNAGEKYRGISTNNVFTIQHVNEGIVGKPDIYSPPPPKNKPRSRPTSKGLKTRKSSQHKLASKSFNHTPKSSESRKNCQRVKTPNGKSRKKSDAEHSSKENTELTVEKRTVDGNSAKRRLGQIERDYQKVVENLGMVERMMACINERISSQKNFAKSSQEMVKSEENAQKQPEIKTKKKPVKSLEKVPVIDMETPKTNKVAVKTDKNEEKMVDEIKGVNKKEEVEEQKIAQDINKQSRGKKITEEPTKKKEEVKHLEETIKLKKEKKKIEVVDESQKKAEELRALNPLSRIKIHDSLSDVDALIENAVHELGNFSSTDFDISQNSSDVSFKLPNEDEARTFYEECMLAASSSNISESEDNDMLGEDAEKFEISKSFQELKDSYLQKMKQENVKKEQAGKVVERNKEPKVEAKNSFEKLHDEIFNDSSWNQIDPEAIDSKLFGKDEKLSNASVGSSFKSKRPESFNEDNCGKVISMKDSSSEEEIAHSKKKTTDSFKELGTEPHYAVMEAVLHTKMEKAKNQGDVEDTITISLPSDKESRSSSKKSKSRKAIPKIQTEQLDDETLQITVTIKDERPSKQENKKPSDSESRQSDRTKGIEEQVVSESELYTDSFEANRKQERTLRKQQKKKIKDRKAGKVTEKSSSGKEKARPKSAKSATTDLEHLTNQAEGEDYSPIIDVYRKDSTEDTPVDSVRSKSKTAKPKFKRKPKKVVSNPEEDAQELSKDIKEIKKVDAHFSLSSTFVSSSSSLEESLFWTKDEKLKKQSEIEPIDPMKQLSIQCKKMIGDLISDKNMTSLPQLMDGHFNSPLLHSLVGRPKRPRSVRIHTPIQDPDLRSIIPEVHRKRAIADLHDRMEVQIRQTDSFDGFLTLMNKTRRKAVIKQAEKQDHNFRCHLKSCFRKRYPFRVVTASVPTSYDSRMKDRKDPEKKYINSLWFSPKDFKLRRNSRIFNRKRMELYCQSLHKGPMVPKCKSKEVASRESKASEKSSNYSILVRSGTPLGRRPQTPRRWIQSRPPSAAGGSPSPRLHHCDILDDLTIKDLAPFNAEYPRHDERRVSESLQGSLLYKLACGGHKGDAEGTLMELIAPKLSCTQIGCKICKKKTKSEKKLPKKQKATKKSGDETPSSQSKANDIQSLSSKAAAQLLIQNIGEIKSRKSSTKEQSSEKSLIRHKESRTKRSVKSLKKNSKKILSQDSKSTIHQRMEENLVKKIFYRHMPMINFSRRSISTSPESYLKPFSSFKGVDPFEKLVKVPEIYPRTCMRKSTTNKLFPYINDPENKVFQNITVLPVKILYDYEPLKDSSEKINELEEPLGCEKPCRSSAPINVACLSETDELEVTAVDQIRPSTADDRFSNKKKTNRRRHGTPRSPPNVHRQDPSKFATVPPKMNGLLFQEAHKTPIDMSNSQRHKENIRVNNPVLYGSKTNSRRSRFRRSSSLGKSTESENGGETRKSAPQRPPKRPGNPNPWIPASRRPKTPPAPKTPIRIRSKEFKNIPQQIQPMKTYSSAKIVAKESKIYEHLSHSQRSAIKMCEKCFSNCSKSALIPQVTREDSQPAVLVNRDKKIKIDMKPTKTFYDIDNTTPKHQSLNASKYRPYPTTPKVMEDHLHSLKSRNVKLQSNIQKAINIIEEKMVDVLSTKDQEYKKKTIDRMEKEINNVLKMINEQSYKPKSKVSPLNIEHQSDTLSKVPEDIKIKRPSTPQHITPDMERIYSVPAMSPKSNQKEERSTHNEKALVANSLFVKMPKPPKKRSISRLLKQKNRPCTVEEGESHFSEDLHLFKINERALDEEYEHLEDISGEVQEEKEQQEEIAETEKQSPELYPSKVMEGQTSLCPILRCPSPKSSITCQNLSRNTQTALRKMSKEAFGKFANIVRTKTRLIINMTERIDLEDSNMLPNPQITSTLPAILAHSTPPVIPQMPQAFPNTGDMMSTTVSSIVSVHHLLPEHILNTSASAGSAPTTEISEFDNGCAERSFTSFGESEGSYTWPRLERTYPMDLDFKASLCSVRHRVSNKDYLTPFMKALNNLRSSRLFQNQHRPIPIEDISPSFTKLMDLLEGLSSVKERLNQRALRDVQLMWNPEKRCSFHSSINSSRGVRFRRDARAISEHSIMPLSSTSSSSEINNLEQIQEQMSRTNIPISNEEKNLGKELYEENYQENTKETKAVDLEITKNKNELDASPTMKVNKVDCEQNEKSRSVKLVLSEIHLISIPKSENLTRKPKQTRLKDNDIYVQKTVFISNENRYATFLKFFYLIFYGLVYFCMSAMNFTC